MNLHNYLYAHANPVNAIDPSGLSTLSTGSQLDLIFAVDALAAIAQPVVSTVFKFKQGTPNEVPPPPPPFPVPRLSEPEILINPHLSLSAKNNQQRLEHKTFTKNPDFSHCVRK